MDRARVAAVLALVWSAIQGWSLLQLGFYPKHHAVGWGLCVVFIAIAIGLWRRKAGARIAFLIIGSGFVIFYGGAFYLTGLPCAKGASGCNAPLVLSQPLLTIAMLALLFRPLASNLTMHRTLRDEAAQRR